MSQNIKNNRNGFSLAETLISLLIVSLIIAATMPIITTKKKTGGDGFWQMNNSSNIYYATGNSQVGVGAAAFTGAGNAKFFINTVAADTRGQIIQRVAGQTANLLEFRKEDGTLLSYFDKDGIYNEAEKLPAGAVMYFNLSACPAGWHKADGSADASNVDLQGYFIRSLSDGSALDSGRGLNTTQQDSVRLASDPPLNGGTLRQGFFVSTTRTVENSVDDPSDASNGMDIGTYFSDGGASSISRAGMTSGAETRPRNVAFLACVKQ